MTGSKMLTAEPTSKVSAATIAAAVTSLCLYVLRAYVFKDGTGLPEPVEYAIGVLITGVVTFAAGYFKSPAAQDVVVPVGAPPADPNGGDPPPP